MSSSDIQVKERRDRQDNNPKKPIKFKERGLKSGWKKNWKIFLSIFAVLFAAFLWYGFQPVKGPIYFGICRNYIEQRVVYPATIRITTWDWFDSGMRIFYTHIDPFGGTRSEVVECIFRPDLSLQDIRVNRRSIGPEAVAKFSATVPIIIANKPDLTYPRRATDDLYDLKRD